MFISFLYYTIRFVKSQYGKGKKEGRIGDFGRIFLLSDENVLRRNDKNVTLIPSLSDLIVCKRENRMFIAKPTKQQLAWHEMELGVLIHYCMEMYRPELPGDWYKTAAVREALDPKTIHPKNLEPE